MTINADVDVSQTRYELLASNMDTTVVKRLIGQGNRTCDEIAEELELTKSHVNRQLKTLAEEPSCCIVRRQEGGQFVYDIDETIDDPNTHVESPDSEPTNLPVHRDTDFSKYIPTEVEEFIGSESVLEEIEAEFTYRSRKPHFLLSGPTGSGKTLLAYNLAAKYNIPLIPIQAKYAMDDADLIGYPMLVNNETRFIDGPITKALLASREGDVIVLIDEVNRAETRAKNSLFSALDDRGQVEINARGGEIIKGDTGNLIIIATANEGREYYTERVDLAERRRLANKHRIDHVGMTDPEAEVNLIVERTPATHDLAYLLVKVANGVRKIGADESVRVVRRGVPTSMVLNWAETAWSYDQAGLSNPVMRAARSALIRPFFDDDEEQYTTVTHIVRNDIDGIEHPFDEEWMTGWFDSDVRDYVDIHPDNLDIEVPTDPVSGI